MKGLGERMGKSRENVPAKEADFGERIVRWYLRVRRDLPWRRTTDPWAVLVSETMLQQTRVETVIPYFLRFMERCPRPMDLAALTEDETHRLWQGLGYYSRARNLRRAAAIIATEHGGRVPSEPQALRALPGIGPYTAGAVLSIAFGIPAPAVDGNVLRVMARWLGDESDISRSETRRSQETVLARLIPADAASDFCQGMMELGALVCTPTAPRCEACPVSDDCAARCDGRQSVLPVKARKPQPVEERLFAAVLVRDGKILLERRGPGLLAGMYGLPAVPSDSDRPQPEAFEDRYGLGLDFVAEIGSATHVFTHRKWFVTAWSAVLASEWADASSDDSSAAPAAAGNLEWHRLDAVADLPIPKAFEKVLALLV